mmetsp:Transcript_4420/g.6471  ORF Transcript_4420/g.6471 Transcript_4420/m.6471 type:complete len:101 (-) Transcript_4420:267-569(-)
MSENVYLLQEINDQRKECHALNQKININRQKIEDLKTGGLFSGPDGDIQRELQRMDMEIEELSRQLNDFEHSNNIIKSQRPHIGQMPPMEGEQQMYQQHY